MANIERSPAEEPLEDLVLRELRQSGMTRETSDLLAHWTRDQEHQVEQENTSRAAIVFNLKRARLYEAAGFSDAALENFRDAEIQAFQENEAELLSEAREGIDRLSQNEG